MNHRLQHFLEQHPAWGWLVTLVNGAMTSGVWFVGHLDEAGKIFAFAAAVFGCIAGWYTLRIQRRTWKRGETRPPFRRSLD